MPGARGMGWRLRERSGPQLVSQCGELFSDSPRLAVGKKRPGTLVARVLTMTAAGVWTDVELGVSGTLLTDPIFTLPCSAPNHKG